MSSRRWIVKYGNFNLGRTERKISICRRVRKWPVKKKKTKNNNYNSYAFVILSLQFATSRTAINIRTLIRLPNICGKSRTWCRFTVRFVVSLLITVMASSRAWNMNIVIPFLRDSDFRVSFYFCRLFIRLQISHERLRRSASYRNLQRDRNRSSHRAHRFET